MAHRMRTFAAILLSATVLSCGGSSSPTGPSDPSSPDTSRDPASLSIYGGNDQEARVGTNVPIAPSVIVKNAAGQPLAGISVTFSVTAGGGALTGATALTDASGIASVGSWTLGLQKQTNTLRAAVDGLPAVTINAASRYPYWTVLVYMAADNTLSVAGVTDIEEMEAAGTSPEVQTVVQAEFSPQQFALYGCDASCIGMSSFNTFRYKIDSGSAPRLGPDGSTVGIGNVDMTDPSVLRNFINWGKSTYPAEHYLLVLWNHGNGSAGLLEDQTSRPGNFMQLGELPLALSAADALDVIDFDMCLMAAYETLAVLDGLADFAVFSEEVEPGDGDPYDRILGFMNSSATASPERVAREIVETYHSSYADARASTTKSAYALQHFPAFDAALKNLADYMRSKLGTLGPDIQQASAVSQRFQNVVAKDIDVLADALGQIPDEGLYQRVVSLRQTLAGDFRVANRARNGTGTLFGESSDVSHAQGLHIVMPSGIGLDRLPVSGPGSIVDYVDQFAETAWTQFLEDWVGSTTRPIVDQGALTRFEGYLVWGQQAFADSADLDFWILEPSGYLYVPWLGMITPNGHLTGDSEATGFPYEGYITNRFIETGLYAFYANLFDAFGGVEPIYSFLYRMDQSGDLIDLYEGQPYPSLSFANSWLDDPAADISKVDAGLYSDLKPAAYWEVTPNATAAVTLGGGASPNGLEKPSFSVVPGIGPGDVSITSEQLETIRRSRVGLRKQLDPQASEAPSVIQQYEWRQP